MEEKRIRQLAEGFIERLHGIEDGDGTAVGAMADLFAEDAELTNPLIEHRDSQLQGRRRVERFWEGYRGNFRNVRSDFSHITTDGEAAGLFWRSVGTDSQGQAVNYEGVSLLEFDGEGRIRRFRGYFDSLQLQRTLR